VLTVAYLANRFPAAVEPYVGDEIRELRRHGVRVLPGSVRTPDSKNFPAIATLDPEMLCLWPLRLGTILRALALALSHSGRIANLLRRIFLQGSESPRQRLKAMLHTLLGIYYAALLKKSGAQHIHVHHGYFGAWIAMVASRLLGIDFSLTLHGSDLLLHAAYLDTKLDNCKFCVTISTYNRRYILEQFPAVQPEKIIIARLGVEQTMGNALRPAAPDRNLKILAVGRLHAVKDHAFLIRACVQLRDHEIAFACVIAGEGPERPHLESLIRKNHLEQHVTLLGHVPQEGIDSLYRQADLVVLTSRSEGLPLVLMEAMVRGRIVLAPAITGIPEIVIPGKTGFLYSPGALDEVVERILFVRELLRAEKEHSAGSPLDWIRHAARMQILQNFDRRNNLTFFADNFLPRIARETGSPSHEDFVLQQI
jgi:colanic acid/amylovoran biosynthesis glycosyltransferase